MKKAKLLFCFVVAGWATGAWGLAKSLLKPAEMPKVFADASFEERMQVLADGYAVVATEYDENGVCISGCAYKGMRIEDEERMVDRAINELQSLMDLENAKRGYNPQQIQAMQQQYLEQLHQQAQRDMAQQQGQQVTGAASQQGQQVTGSVMQQTTAQQMQQPQYQQPVVQQGQQAQQKITQVKQPATSPSQQMVQPPQPSQPTQQPSPRVVSSDGAQAFFGPPVAGNVVVVSDFGRRVPPKTSKGVGSEFHRGVDVRAQQGTPLYATADGKVIHAGNQSGCGQTVRIEHSLSVSSKKIWTDYCHMSKIIVKVGDMVTKGQRIGDAGNTGNSGGAHLHYALYFDGVQVDPLGSHVKPIYDRSVEKAWGSRGTNYLGAPYCLRPGMTSYRLRKFKGDDAALRENFPQCTGWCH